MVYLLVGGVACCLFGLLLVYCGVYAMIRVGSTPDYRKGGPEDLHRETRPEKGKL